jgi:hypothetical protein
LETRIYIHETVQIGIKHRKDYLDHFCQVWAPRSRELYGMLCFGVWATNGSTGNWPEAIVMWELADRAAYTAMMSGEFQYLASRAAPMKGHYEEFWAPAPKGVVETIGYDRLLAAMPGTPPLAEAIEQGRRGCCYYQQVIQVSPGGIEPYLEHYDHAWRPIAEEHGLVHIGSYRATLGNDSEGVVLWALPTWNHWVAIDDDLRRDERARSFHTNTAPMAPAWRGTLLVGAQNNPLDIGRIL